jgi:dimethylargininase
VLERLGLDVVELEALRGFPDAHFVEDTAIVGDSFAVLARPGAPERRGEEEAIAPVLGQFRTLESIEGPGTVDGGDVLAPTGRRGGRWPSARVCI